MMHRIKLPAQYAPVVALAMSALAVGLLLTLTGAFEREELQLINKRFEWRYLLWWHPTSIARLQHAFQYHQQHEQPALWDYTISWVLENNRPQASTNIAIFNRTTEDEPPVEAVADHPWMRPLTRTPMPRATVAQMVTVLAKAGAKTIILDNDFPQYTDDDAALARAIHDAASGHTTGKPVPVLMVRSVYRQSSNHLAVAQTVTSPNGVLDQLQKLEPETNVVARYTGTACLYTDRDQTVRRILTRILSAPNADSIVLKALQTDTSNVPDVLDINFIAPPNSDIFKVRPLTYLLDPDRVHDLLNPSKKSQDIQVQNAIVIIGDGITDVFDTPYTNAGINSMSGSEVIAHAINTVAARNWVHRPDALQSIVFVLLAVTAAAGAYIASRRIHLKKFRILADMGLICGLLILWNLFSAIVFTTFGIITPIVIPEICIVAGLLAAILLEREQQRIEAIERKFEAAEVRHEGQLALEKAQGKLREIMTDRQRRRELVRQINHDLKAPLTVLNWNLAKLCSDGLQSNGAQNKVERLKQTSDRLYDLVGQLTQTYDESTQVEKSTPPRTVLAPLLSSTVAVCQSLAEMNNGKIILKHVAEDAAVVFEPVELSRVMENLIKNAFVHNPSRTKVTVSVDSSDDLFIIKVADNGKGIASDHLEKVFDSEYRVNPDDGKGTGLGLTIVKSLVEQSGGHITVVSQVNHGTTFLIALRSAGAVAIDPVIPLPHEVSSDEPVNSAGRR